MLPYLARRIANYAVLLFIATSLAYLLASASLDPSALWNRQDPSLNWDAIHANLVKYNISHDLPVWDRYVTWLRNVLFHWDWGRTPKGELINTLIGTKIFVSVRLVFLGAAIGMVGGVALGAWTATRQYRFSDRAISLISMIIISTPAMVIAILLQVLAVQINRSSGFQIFEFTGEGEGALGRLQHLLLPTLSMSLGGIASYSRFQRNLMLDTLGADYVRTARAKGLANRAVMTRHILRNSLIPVATFLGGDLGALMGGAIITEGIFNINGVGGTLWQAIRLGEAPTVVSITTVLVLVYILANLIVDLLYAVLDPRIRYE